MQEAAVLAGDTPICNVYDGYGSRVSGLAGSHYIATSGGRLYATAWAALIARSCW